MIRARQLRAQTLMPSVSVIITSHDRPQLLRRAIESAQAAAADAEVIVVDDASSDETAEVCRHFSDIRYVRVERNQKVAGARSIGLLHSRAEYVSFLDDDDVRLALSLDLQVEALRSQPEVGLIYAQALIAHQNGLVSTDFYPQACPQGDVFWELLAENFIPCGTVVFRRSCLLRVGLPDAAVPGIDDWDLWVRIASCYRVMALEQPVLIWRKSLPGSGQGTSRADRLVRMSTRQLHEHWLKLPRAEGASPSERRKARRRFSQKRASQLAAETARALEHRQFGCAWKNIFAALCWHPWASVRVATSSAAIRHLRRALTQAGAPPREFRSSRTESGEPKLNR